MINFLNKIFKKQKNSSYINLSFQELDKDIGAKKIFTLINNHSDLSEIRYVGGCVRKIINHESVDDIDLAVNLTPKEICEILEKNQIKFYETGLAHGTITAIINHHKFEITSLRKDIETDGRNAKVEFTKDWLEDASRRDFSINSIYADLDGNLYDPFDGKKNIEIGLVDFIGNEETRIKEDYLRIMRYIRFFLNYSKTTHKTNTIRSIKKNLGGVSKISPERLLDEFSKLAKSNGFLRLSKDKFCLDIINLIFPQFKNIDILKNITKNNIKNLDFIILLSLLIIDSSDNTEYFLFKFNLSKVEQKRILFLKEVFSKPIKNEIFTKNNLWKIIYYNGKHSLLDLINFQIFKSKKDEKKLVELVNFFKDKLPPKLPIKASFLMSKFNVGEGKHLGLKLKKIEEKWVSNNFKITDKEVQDLMVN